MNLKTPAVTLDEYGVSKPPKGDALEYAERRVWRIRDTNYGLRFRGSLACIDADSGTRKSLNCTG